jgi:hypothetical protein
MLSRSVFGAIFILATQAQLSLAQESLLLGGSIKSDNFLIGEAIKEVVPVRGTPTTESVSDDGYPYFV